MSDVVIITEEIPGPAGPLGGTSTIVSYGAAASYQMLATDVLVVFDSSAWVAQGALVAALPVAPYVGQRCAFFWDKWVLGSPPPIVNAGGNPIVPYSQNSQASGARAPGNETAITDFGGLFAVLWSGSAWLPG